MADILAGLNIAQRDAVTSPAAVLQVLAPPGSGKTKTLTTRVAHLISHRQLKPWNIIVCTFTVKAAKEMQERIRGFVGEGLEKQLILGTFHRVAVRYLRRYGQHIGLERDFGIADTNDSKAILKRIIKQYNLSIEPGVAIGRISRQKVKSEDPVSAAGKSKTVEQQEFALLFDKYEEALQKSNLLDYDDLLLKCSFLLRTHPECVANVQAVLIDEFQDTNNVQYDLMGLFAQRLNTITIVGDPDQSIYGFRFAEIKNLARMKAQWPNTITINLEENYRSSGSILHAAQKVIEQDESRPPKQLQATHTAGQRPVLRKLPTAAGEAEWLVSEIKRMQALTGNMLQPSDFAILLRSAMLSRPIETALGAAGLPYRMIGGVKFFDRVEVKLVLDYLRVMSQPNNSEAIERIINVPSRKVGEVALKALKDEASNKGVTLWKAVLDSAQGRSKANTKLSKQALQGIAAFTGLILTGRRKLEAQYDHQKCSINDLIDLVVKKILLQDFLKQKYPDDFDARWASVEELMIQAAEASSIEDQSVKVDDESLPLVDGMEQREVDSDEDQLSSFLSNIALSSAAEQKAENEGEPIQQTTLSTVHAAKGLEWPVVFIPACYDGSIPHSRAEDNDEERRLLYVGMTRAKALLYLSCPVKNAQREETTMSTFLTQPGVSAYFEEHGPSIDETSVKGFATTLGRTLPPSDEIKKTRTNLESEEDNYWPLTGEERSEEFARWDYQKATKTSSLPGFSRPASWVDPKALSTSTTSMTPGFTSVASRFDELMATHEDGQLRKIDKRAQDKQKGAGPGKGRKRQLEGQESIANFFGAKRTKPSPEPSPEPPMARTVSAVRTSGSARDTVSTKPLGDISNIDTSERADAPVQKLPSAFRRPLATPLPRPNKTPVMTEEESAANNDYVFLSSPPPRKNDSKDAAKSGQIPEDEPERKQPPTFRPASTFHTTSVSTVGSSRPKKTLGVRRSMNGWADRMGKG
ncbi:hypothetical protein MBLNU230_g2520t1 [Neophaeotheca triangularis]